MRRKKQIPATFISLQKNHLKKDTSFSTKSNIKHNQHSEIKSNYSTAENTPTTTTKNISILKNES